MQRASWLNAIANARGEAPSLPRNVLDALAKLDDALFGIWDLGDNVVLAWTHAGGELRFLAVRHYAIAEAIHGGPASPATSDGPAGFVNEVLSGYEFHQIDGLNPTTFSYIVGQVTIDLSRMIDKALPGQILLGDFSVADQGR